jgi:hypothetical protein
VLAQLLVKSPADRTTGLVELRAQLSRLDLAGNAVTAPTAGSASGSRPPPAKASRAEDAAPEVAAAAAGEGEPRYRFETPLGGTSISTLWRAVDSVLERSVILERFEATDEATLRMERVRLLARAHTPFLQRALGLDRLARTAVFEAPSGATLADARPELSAAELVRVMKRMARGIAAIHELGGWHGAIDARTVVLDEANVPTLLTCGLGPVTGGSAADDVAAVIAVIASLAGSPPGPAELWAAIAARVEAAAPPAPSALPADGEALYAVADALDVVVLSALGAR